VTYANFGQTFMTTYCTPCHSSQLKDLARNSATVGYDFDTQAGVQQRLEAIDKEAASGPSATNTFMPLTSSRPSEADRQKLGEWLACGAL
jgi:uncharacterized membrane protein